jgi:hypothetical protein
MALPIIPLGIQLGRALGVRALNFCVSEGLRQLRSHSRDVTHWINPVRSAYGTLHPLVNYDHLFARGNFTMSRILSRGFQHASSSLGIYSCSPYDLGQSMYAPSFGGYHCYDDWHLYRHSADCDLLAELRKLLWLLGWFGGMDPFLIAGTGSLLDRRSAVNC